MYLKALEIQGFKSFADKTVLTFGEDITAIVGPNGSGKSNISDAIRWVMGEQSTRALRGGKMEDVIFGGTQKRKQQGFAEVSLILDNTAHLFDMEESEVMVTRRYYRSGESEYYINRRSVRLKDVNELFMDTGLGREGYSIIGQGKIDEILSTKSADRRDVFEEAAGISRFRHRKEEAERKLEHTDENLVRINDKVEELELRVEPLRAQAEKAKKFLILRDELRGLEISVWLDNLETARQSGIKYSADYEAALRQKDSLQRAVEEMYAQTEALSAQMREKDVAADAVRFHMSQRSAEKSELESAAAVLRANVTNNLHNAERMQDELSRQEGRAGSILRQITERKALLTSITEEKAGLRKQCDALRQEMNDAAAGAGSVREELQRLREKEAVETASASEARALLSALAAAAQELLDRDEAVHRELAEGEARLEEERQNQRAAQKEYQDALEERDSLKNVISGYELRLESRRKKAKQLEDDHMKLQMEEHALTSRIQLLREMEKEYEGFSKAVKLVMNEAGRGALRGICGPVASLLHVPDRFTVAIETALGGAMQHIVVEREEDGKAAIQYLKRRDGGRATFLPISSIRPGYLKEAGVEREKGFLGVADQLIEFDGRYAPVFANLLGRVVIAEDLDAAIAIARKYGYRFRIVTLDGQVLNAGGSMTGGSASRSAGILSRANELERLGTQLDGIQSRRKATLQSMEDAKRELTAAEYECSTAADQQRALEDTMLQQKERCDRYESVVRDLERTCSSRREELRQMKDRMEKTEADTVKARKRMEELEGTAAALRAEAEGKQKGQTDLQEKTDALNAELAGLSAKLAALETREQAAQQSMSELEAMHQDLAGDRQQQMQRLEAYQQQNEDLKGQIAEKEAQLQALAAETAGQEQKIQTLNQEKLQLEAERNRLEKDSRDKNSTLLGMEREVSLLEQKKNGAAMEEKQILDKLWETYELSHEAAVQQRQPLESLPKAQKRISELKRGISALGNINVDAIEEFEQVNERYTYFIDQRSDVEKAKSELEAIIRDITSEMKTIFARQFAVLNQAFSETFLELFGGGRAALELEDPDDILNCGIEIRVQPPGKALKIISLLSGGEKAFVAIALYFAILKVRPTPFVVMDEIEAALDDSNVVRFANYMRKMSDKTQFIVITHRRGTMEEADVLYGVTMQEQGVSRMLTINLNDVEKELNIK